MTSMDEELDPYAGPFRTERDLALSFQWRSDPGVIAALDLPPARNPRHEDARNAVLTEAKLAAERGRWISYSRRPAFYVGRSFYHGNSFRYAMVPGAVSDGVRANLLEEGKPGAAPADASRGSAPLPYCARCSIVQRHGRSSTNSFGCGTIAGVSSATIITP